MTKITFFKRVDYSFNVFKIGVFTSDKPSKVYSFNTEDELNDFQNIIMQWYPTAVIRS